MRNLRCAVGLAAMVASSAGAALAAGGGTLFGTDGSAGNLITVDVTTGAGAVVGALGFSAPALAVDPTTGIMYRRARSAGRRRAAWSGGEPAAAPLWSRRRRSSCSSTRARTRRIASRGSGGTEPRPPSRTSGIRERAGTTRSACTTHPAAPRASSCGRRRPRAEDAGPSRAGRRVGARASCTRIRVGRRTGCSVFS